jgi:hypothetical protein
MPAARLGPKRERWLGETGTWAEHLRAAVSHRAVRRSLSLLSLYSFSAVLFLAQIPAYLLTRAPRPATALRLPPIATRYVALPPIERRPGCTGHRAATFHLHTSAHAHWNGEAHEIATVSTAWLRRWDGGLLARYSVRAPTIHKPTLNIQAHTLTPYSRARCGRRRSRRSVPIPPSTCPSRL